MTFTEFARVSGTHYVTGQTRYEEKPSETIMKVLDKIERTNTSNQLFNILLARLIREKKQYEGKFSMETILLAMYMREK